MGFSYEEVSKIMESSRDTTESNRNYKMLYKGFFQKLWDERINKLSYFCIYMETSVIDNMKFDVLSANITELNDAIKDSNFIKINEFGQVIEKSYKACCTEDMKSELTKLSWINYVFFFGENGITRYINGMPIDDVNVFYSREDRMKYLEKKDISQLDKVIHEYATQNVTQQVNYMCFFADNPTLRQINPEYVNKNILKNKPEHFMRDHLRQYLTDHMRYTFTIEPELGQSKRELDIYFDVCGELYFIEIKWLGVSINDQGNGLSNPYTDCRAREGITQTLEYIKELSNTTETSLRCGCLAIYDAREKKDDIEFQDFNFIKEDLKEYMQNLKLLETIPLCKLHSA